IEPVPDRIPQPRMGSKRYPCELVPNPLPKLQTKVDGLCAARSIQPATQRQGAYREPEALRSSHLEGRFLCCSILAGSSAVDRREIRSSLGTHPHCVALRVVAKQS